MNPEPSFDRGQWAALACLWEATARKAGNVHPGQSFADLNYADFVVSAVAIAPVFRQGAGGVGPLVLRAAEATRRVVRSNTNLGMVLLLAPLAVVPDGVPLREGVAGVLDRLTLDDSRHVYAAIRLAQPGGMGDVPEQDLRDEPTLPLRDVMALAADRDLIARQYANGFREVFEDGVPALLRGVQASGSLEDAIVATHLHLLARHGDSLIARKCGAAVAAEAARGAAEVLAGRQPLADFDAWLRGDGHRRNPGATADLVAACIFAALRDNSMGLPLSVPWSRG